MVDNIYIGLGSNKGNRLQSLREAVKKIKEHESCKVLAVSSVYESKPYGNPNQENFYNAVIEIDTGLGVIGLFEFLKNIEKDLGRKEDDVKWGPREIDLDILFLNTLVYDTGDIIIPHPEVFKRDFVIVPLLEIAPDYVPPGQKKKLREIDFSDLDRYIIGKLDSTLI
ncbi:7, 8-Dihydro-6-hydroxymethylpterin-pyrophosphokinase [Melioribacter roseus P3M-2]|uniref:2-amino-4-hydroxy-6-hydroxymethyldihydropteridine pyrophosphokinase n=1 Tax=Melioribacter roseus (strain DSM 23840 / JCM 17771 / VKM B-2668 / P3M-2) TaxID=1191523 RepID=I6YS63_MELRP|nr:2-amino-4-hydroxy-6-hydroxymethyldihydropteridine diphosphokinase [Melioribacter roseus]AFN73387.1 7, 8-Dihydro-6-hydroxymethylpterin-pyrophosphokinase [Melioribacter roseus P3M-2]